MPTKTEVLSAIENDRIAEALDLLGTMIAGNAELSNRLVNLRNRYASYVTVKHNDTKPDDIVVKEKNKLVDDLINFVSIVDTKLHNRAAKTKTNSYEEQVVKPDYRKPSFGWKVLSNLMFILLGCGISWALIGVMNLPNGKYDLNKIPEYVTLLASFETNKGILQSNKSEILALKITQDSLRIIISENDLGEGNIARLQNIIAAMRTQITNLKRNNSELENQLGN